MGLGLAQAGKGGRPLLLVHGFTGAKEDFAEVLAPLAEAGWHAVAPDLPGHGESRGPGDEGAYSLDGFVADLLMLADALGWTTFALLGHSMGGMIAQRLVISHPHRVSALVLMDTAHGVPDGLDADAVALGQSIVREHGMLTLLALQNERRERDLQVTPAHLRLLRERPGYGEYCDRKLLASSPAMWLAMTGEFLNQADRLDALASLSIPVLVIVGEQDESYLGHAERLAKAIPSAQLAVIADAGHAPQFENPAAWWDTLRNFLEELADE
jgi:3-oxoadipate enol-lactonase